MANEEFKTALNGYNLDVAHAIYVAYKGAPNDLVYVPIEAKDDSTNALWVYVRPKENKVIGVAVFTARLGQEDGDFTITLSQADGTEMGRIQYEAGKLADKWFADLGEDRIGVQGEDWGCFWRCIQDFWKHIPDPVKWACSFACFTLCRGGNPYGCTACAICLGTWRTSATVFAGGSLEITKAVLA